MRHQMSNKRCQGICQKITVNGPKDRLDDRICTDLGWFAGFVWMWQRQKWEWHQMAGRPHRALRGPSDITSSIMEHFD